MLKYSLLELEDIIVTQGISDLIGKEFSVKRGNYSESSVKSVIDYILNYIRTENKVINDRETFGCGSWLFQFVFNGMYIELHELKDVVDGKNIYAFDLTNTITFLNEQMDICTLNNVSPSIPRIGQKIALSKEIYNGAEVNAVRYPAPDHMSGWYLTTNSYDGNIKSLKVDHLFHLLKSRPELAKFLALPYGFRFYKDKNKEEIWFDKEVLK